jgi:hypothetical protein
LFWHGSKIITLKRCSVDVKKQRSDETRYS